MFEAKDQGHKRKCCPKKGLQKTFSGNLQKKRFSEKYFRQCPEKIVLQKIFQAHHKLLTTQKIMLFSSQGQGNFRGLKALRPMLKPRTSKCVLEDVFEAKDVLEDFTFGVG